MDDLAARPTSTRPSPLAIDKLLRQRVTEAVIAQGGFRHEALNAFLRERLAGDDVSAGALFSEPAIEGAASYVSSGRTPASLKGDLLHPDVVEALTYGEPGEDYRFDYPAYAHQLEAWRLLTGEASNSVLVSSGTGSGKTECFLVPLLDDLAREAERDGSLSGVRALMLYPLNALIASQEERLRRWTKPFGGRIRFGLYNGLMLDKGKGDRDRAESETPEQVRYRTTLRANPPPILVTNNTMLEYMTIRRQDQPILDKSRGKLRWIVIDEAHSYVGSAAAEVALLLRRVLHAFGVEAKSVRFVATSATIGASDDKAREDLQAYLADLAGVPRSQVHVVIGAREAVALPPAGPRGPLSFGDSSALARNPDVQTLVREAEKGAVSLRRAASVAQACGAETDLLIEAIAAQGADGSSPLLPMRVHKFLRAVPGLWSCLNPDCGARKPTNWPFGGLHFQREETCPHCTSPLFELLGCRECGEPWLNAFDHGDRLGPLAAPPDKDEFAAASDQNEDGAPDSDDEALEEQVAAPRRPGQRRLIAARAVPGVHEVSVDPKTGALPERRSDGPPIWISGSAGDGACPRCHAAPTRHSASPLWPFRFGAPFLVQNATPTMLDGVASAPRANKALPADGRQLLSFTDSRQGTARFAANIETMSERGYVRAFVYHMVQKEGASTTLLSEEKQQLELEIAELRALVASSPILAGTLNEKEAKLAGLVLPKAVAWKAAVTALSSDPMVNQWVRAVWDRDDRYRRDPDAFGQFLLFRELARRPRRANAVETLGLAKLTFQDIEKLSGSSVPPVLKAKGIDAAGWRDFLYYLVDNSVRGQFALQIPRADARWLLPRKAFLRNIVGPGQDRANPSDAVWPQARPIGSKSEPVQHLERVLGLDSADPEGRSIINDVLMAAWLGVRPLLETAGSTYALSFERVELSLVSQAWQCPVTHKVLPRLVFGRTPYGLRSGAPGHADVPVELAFPVLPATFPRSHEERAVMDAFVSSDEGIQRLRQQGNWGALHDRAAGFSPYMRAEEHSAQQPPHRLREFEAEFKKGEINLLACSTTMEMGVDIGSVEAVLNTNVPPSIANYRQRIGRAGRRGQSFSSSLTFARDTPLDRESFTDPTGYLKRALRSPQVKLDSERIVQRHVNALLLARWFREADAQLTKTKSGDFFGLPPELGVPPPTDQPVQRFVEWLSKATTAVQLHGTITALVAGTALDGRADLLDATREAYANCGELFGKQWEALRAEAESVSPEARGSIERQLKRLCGEPLLKELANRSILPSHGFPTAVVPFINDCRENRERARETGEEAQETDRAKRYDYPSRNADIAIREYAPGAEIVVDGLVWTSAGVTLNWRRPAQDSEAHDIQSIRNYWTCRDCGETGCATLRPERCTSCASEQLEHGRFLEPAGFRVDWLAEPHANTDQAIYIEPEPPRVSAGEADWRPLLDPALGRLRAADNGRVFHLSLGAKKEGYRICLECGRAAEEAEGLTDHHALMPRKGEFGRCSGNDRTYTITAEMALGHEVLTDVAEFQPVGLSEPGSAWALASALREVLARRLGIEVREIGLSVARRTGSLGQATHSIYLFDQASGGAGYSPRLVDSLPEALQAARQVLDCPFKCDHGCSGCVLTADLFAQQTIVDRKSALTLVEGLLSSIAAPQADDLAMPGAMLSASVADALIRGRKPGDRLTLFVLNDLDLGALNDPPFSTLFETVARTRASAELALSRAMLDGLDEAARRGLRNASHRHRFVVVVGSPVVADNGAFLLATCTTSSGTSGYFTRDVSASIVGPEWGVGNAYPIVCAAVPAPAIAPVTEDEMERSHAPADRVYFISSSPGQASKLFGKAFVKNVLKPELEAARLWHPGDLTEITYSDRYLKAPLPVLLMGRTLAALREMLAPEGASIPVKVLTEPLRSDPNMRRPVRLGHNWQDEDDRTETVEELFRLLNLDIDYSNRSAAHGRRLTLSYASQPSAVVFLDQGFGYWRATSADQHDFHAGPARQARAMLDSPAFVSGSGESYIAVGRR